MSIVQDMDAEFVAQRPLPPGSTWLVGGNVWHALMADLVRIGRETGFPAPIPPETLFGLPVRHVHRMTGWGIAEPLDAAVAEEHTQGQLELTPHDIAS